MSAYRYGYSLAPARPSGWRSIIAGSLTVVAVVAVSAMSGALVMAELIGPRSAHAPTSTAPATMTAIEIPAAHKPVARDVPASATATVRAAETQNPPAAPVPSPSPAPQSVSAVAVAPQAAPAAAEPQAASKVPESELTFAKGYAQRHAAHTAAEQSAAQRSGAHIAAAHEFGRPAVVAHKPTYARTYGGHDARRLAAREPFDWRRDRALAYGEQYQNRRSYGQPGGIFGNLFGGGNLF